MYDYFYYEMERRLQLYNMKPLCRKKKNCIVKKCTMCICTTLAHQKILFTLIVLSFNDNNCNNNNMCSKSKYYIRMQKNTVKK